MPRIVGSMILSSNVLPLKSRANAVLSFTLMLIFPVDLFTMVARPSNIAEVSFFYENVLFGQYRKTQSEKFIPLSLIFREVE
jgi:hypothetical protein